MILTVKNNLPELLKFWEYEQTTPRWFRETCRTNEFDEKDYLDWCAKMWRIYGLLDNKAAVMVAKHGTRAEIHFSFLPDADKATLIDELIQIRADIFCAGIEVIFGWVARQNRGLRKICEQLGLTFYGFRRFSGESHGRVIEWQCYGISQASILVAKPQKIVLSLG